MKFIKKYHFAPFKHVMLEVLFHLQFQRKITKYKIKTKNNISVKFYRIIQI